MHIKQHILRTIGAWGLLLAFTALFKPDSLPVVVLIVPFVLLFMAFYSLWNLLALVRLRYFARERSGSLQKPLGIAVCLSAVLLIVLQSLGQLTLRDIVTVAAIVVLGYLYLARSRFVLPKR